MDNILIAFINIGPYHLARIKSAHNTLKNKSINLHILELTNNSLEHSWGNIDRSFTDKIFTLINLNKSQFSKESKDFSHPRVNQIALNDYLKKIKPNLIFVPGWSFELSKSLLKWAKKNNVNTVLMSETKENDKRRNFIIEIFKKFFILPKYSAALVGGKSHANYLEKLGIQKDNIYFGYDVVDNDFFRKKSELSKINKSKILKKYNLSDEPFFLGAFRLIKRKNTIRLIKSYSIYFEKYGNKCWPLIICGDGSEYNELIKLVKNLKLEKKVRFLGFLDYEAVSDLYGLASCLVHSALVEQWGLVINEACAASLPLIISNRVGACDELVEDGKNGFIFDPFSESQIFTAFEKIHNLSVKELNEMGKRSYKKVEKLSPEKFGNAVIDIYERTLQK